MKNKLMSGYNLTVTLKNEELKGKYTAEDSDLIDVENVDLEFLKEERNIMNCLALKKAFSLTYDSEKDNYRAMIKVLKYDYTKDNPEWVIEYEVERNGIEKAIIDLNDSIIFKNEIKGEKVKWNKSLH